MSLVPEKLFVNLYPKAIGTCVGAAYETREEADRYANSHRLLCVELGARSANAVILSDSVLAKLNSLAKKHETGIVQVIESALAIHEAIPNEVRVLLPPSVCRRASHQVRNRGRGSLPWLSDGGDAVTLTPEQNEILDLRDKVADLQEMVASLRGALGADEIMFPLEWKLSRQEADALRCLYKSENGFRNHNTIHSAIAKSGDAVTHPHIVAVTICRLRKSLANADIDIGINTRRGEGYELPAGSRAVLEQHIQRHVGEVAV